MNMNAAGSTKPTKFNPHARLSKSCSKPAEEGDRKRARTGGTSVLFFADGRGYSRSNKIGEGKKGAGQEFHVFSCRGIIGRPDNAPEEGIMVDETANEIVFKLRDPAAVKAGDNCVPKVPFSEIPRNVEVRYKIGSEITIEINGVTGIDNFEQTPCLLYLSAFEARAWRGDPKNPFTFKLSAGNARVCSEIINSPSALLAFTKQCIPYSTRYEQPTLYTSIQLKGKENPNPKAKNPLIFPPKNGVLHHFPVIVKTDYETLAKELGDTTADKGCSVFFFDKLLPANWFYKKEGKVWSNIAATEDTCDTYNITVRLPIHICQWDTSIDPMQRMPMDPDQKHHVEEIETKITVWPKQCWTFGVTRQINYFSLSFHISGMIGSVFFRDNLHATSKIEANIIRQSQIDSCGNATDTRLLANASIGSFLMDIRGYLMKVGMPVSFQMACKILGAKFSSKESIIMHNNIKGKCRDNMGKEKILQFENKDVVCLNEYSQDLHKVDARAIGYRVLTGFVPNGIAERNALANGITEALTDVNVFKICDISKSFGNFTAALSDRSGAVPDAVLDFLGKCKPQCYLPPLVFAILGQKSEAQKKKVQTNRDYLVRQWKLGPSVMSATEGKHLKPVPKDEIDQCLPPAQKKQRTQKPEAERPLPETPDSPSPTTTQVMEDSDDDDDAGSDTEASDDDGAADDEDGDTEMKD